MGSHKAKKKTVTPSLSKSVAHRKRLRILSSFGSVDFAPKYDYQAERKMSNARLLTRAVQNGRRLGTATEPRP
jgi:hypothetical protein